MSILTTWRCIAFLLRASAVLSKVNAPRTYEKRKLIDEIHVSIPSQLVHSSETLSQCRRYSSNQPSDFTAAEQFVRMLIYSIAFRISSRRGVYSGSNTRQSELEKEATTVHTVCTSHRVSISSHRSEGIMTYCEWFVSLVFRIGLDCEIL